jgi:hypothetical protein
MFVLCVFGVLSNQANSVVVDPSADELGAT